MLFYLFSEYQIQKELSRIDWDLYEGRKVIVKGCSDFIGKEFAYAFIASELVRVVRSLFYGEACSSVVL